jgi:hypothetical protein
MNTHDRQTIMHTTGQHKDIEVILQGPLIVAMGFEDVRSLFLLRFLWLRYPLELVEQPGRLLESLHTAMRPDPGGTWGGGG